MNPQRSIFGASTFMGLVGTQVPLTVELHDELDLNHVMGCPKCKKKKRQNGYWPFELPEEDASEMI